MFFQTFKKKTILKLIKIIFKNKLIVKRTIFLKIGENNFYLFFKIVLNFTLLLIFFKNNDQMVLKIFKNIFLFLKTKTYF